jgi:hypothetical protein
MAHVTPVTSATSYRKTERLAEELHAKEPYLLNMPCTVRAMSEHKKNDAFCPYKAAYLYEGLGMFLAIHSTNWLVFIVNAVRFL